MKLLNKNATIVPVEQGTEPWFNSRVQKITGTLVPLLANPSIVAYKRFMGLDSFSGNKHTERGNTAEPLIRTEINKSGMDFREIVIEQDGMQGSLDGISADATTVLEIKCPETVESKMYKTALKGEVPKDHMLQMQFYMMLSGATKALYVVGLLPENSFTIDTNSVIQIEVKACEKTHKQIKENAGKFLKLIGSNHFEQSNDLELDAEHMELADKYIKLKDDEKKMKAELTYLADILKSYEEHEANGISVISTKGRETTDWKEIAKILKNTLISDYSYDNELVNEIINKHTKTSEPTLQVRLK